VPLNLSCRTSGNECTSDNQCCSGSCVDDGTGTDTDRCDGAASFCRQEGDICIADYQCCGATCDKADGAAVGTCDPSPAVSGVQSCNIAGMFRRCRCHRDCRQRGGQRVDQLC
jgi:hypothetical protein